MKPFRLRLELLEERITPTTFGNPWPDPTHLTLSFAPDGTAVGNQTSVLFRTLNQNSPTATWEREILRAFQTWAVQTNSNIGLVADGGQAFGTPGLPEGDPRFGDIRLAAYPLSADEMGIASPFDPTAGTWSGDVKLASQINFGTGGSGQVDLYTVALHEAGHVFGLADSTDPTNAMYDHYLGPRTGPSAADIAALQQNYGVRTPDAFEGTNGNGTLATATPVNLLTNPDGSLGIQVNGDVTTLKDVDVYRFQAPLNLGSLNVHLQVAGLSLLNARMTVYDGNGRVVGSAQSTDPLNNDLVVKVPQFLPLGTYYVKVQSATQDVFGIGSYQLHIQSLPLVGALTGTLQNVVGGVKTLANNTLDLNGSMLTATLLPPLFSQTASAFAFSYQGKIQGNWDVDYYRLQMPAGSTAQAMNVMVWGTDSNLIPQATVYDGSGQPVAADVLVNENGTFMLQVTHPTAGATYFVKVQAADPNSHNTGNYSLAVDSSKQVVQLTTITQGTLTAAQPQNFGALTVNQGQLFHFTLSASTGTTAQAGVRVTIYNSDGTVMASVLAQNGKPAASGTVYLPQGVYGIRIAGGTPNGSVLPPIQYMLKGEGQSDPIGPQPESPTQSPSSGTSSGTPPPPPSGGSTTTSGSSSSTTTTSSSSGSSTSTTGSSSSSGTSSTPDKGSWYGYSDGDNRGLAPEDAYSNPYQSA